MKYILLILGFSLIFQPHGDSKKSSCCVEGMERVYVQHPPTMEKHRTCCSSDSPHQCKKEDQSSEKEESHKCNNYGCQCCFATPVFLALYLPLTFFVHTIEESQVPGYDINFLGRYVHSVWIPPNFSIL